MAVYSPKATTYARFMTWKSHIWTLEAYIRVFAAAASLLSVAVEKFTYVHYLFIDDYSFKHSKN